MSETGLVYTFTTPKLQPLVTKAEGKNLIQVCALCRERCRCWILESNRARQACLNAPEPAAGNENGVDDSNQVESPEEPANAHLPPQQTRPGMPPNHMPPNYMANVPMDPLAYSNYVQQTRGAPQYSMPQPGLQQHTSHQS